MGSSSTMAATSPLALLSEVAARLVGADDVVRKTSDILERVVTGFSATECALWLTTPAGMVSAVRRGQTETPVHDVLSLVESGRVTSDSLQVRRLVAAGKRIGALVLRVDGPCPPDTVLAFGAIADMLAPELARAEHARQLASDADGEKRFFEHVIDALPVGLYVIDRDYRVTLWNRKRESGSQGVHRDQALGKTIFEILHRAPAAKLRREFDEVFQTGRLQQFHMETRGPGDKRTFRISKVPVRLPEGGPVTHVITIGEDVTHWNAARDRIAQSEKLAAIGRLAAGVMHEIDAPLTAIATSSRRIREASGEGSAGDLASREVEAIDHELDRCRALVEGLRQLGRPGTQARRATSLNTAIEQTLSLLRHHERFKRLTFATSLASDLGPVQADPDQLVQVFVALINNAEEAMEQGGTITLHTRRGDGAEDAVIAEVIDEGQGIPGDMLPKIFDPFFTTKAATGGTGLGLSICHSIVSDHGGHMAVDSAMGVGSTFRIFLPGAEAL